MQSWIVKMGAAAVLSSVVYAGNLSPCEQLAIAVPEASWSAQEWRQHEDAVQKWEAKKGIEVYNKHDPRTSAYRVPGDNTSFKELEALSEVAKKVEFTLSEEKLAYSVPSDSWNCAQWRAYKEANAAVDAQ